MGRSGRGSKGQGTKAGSTLQPTKKPSQPKENVTKKRKARERTRAPHQQQRRAQKQHIKQALLSPTNSINDTVPAYTLSPFQVAKILDKCLMVSLQKEKDCYSWKEQSRGKSFNESGEGAILTTAKSMQRLPSTVNVFYSGHGSQTTLQRDESANNRPSSDDTHVLLSLWLHFETDGQQPELDTTAVKKIAEEVRLNINDGQSHFQSTGKCFGFGVRGGYDRIDPKTLASFNQCASKNGKTEKKLKAASSKIVQDWTAARIVESTNRISAFVGGNPVRDGSVLIEAAQSLCEEKIEGIKDRIEMIGGTYFTSLYFNCNVGSTPHQEKDGAYTLISVPKQSDTWNLENCPLFFKFHLTTKKTLTIPMTPLTDIYYNAFFLCHNQECLQHRGDNQHVNVAAYGNRKLLQNVRTTLLRNK